MYILTSFRVRSHCVFPPAIGCALLQSSRPNICHPITSWNCVVVPNHSSGDQKCSLFNYQVLPHVTKINIRGWIFLRNKRFFICFFSRCSPNSKSLGNTAVGLHMLHVLHMPFASRNQLSLTFNTFFHHKHKKEEICKNGRKIYKKEEKGSTSI